MANQEHISIADRPFDPDETLASFRKLHPYAGAIVSFTGQVRNLSDGNEIQSLTLEHYPGFTENEIAKIAENMRGRWLLLGFRIVHRVGLLVPGDPIILVATAASHRRTAFEAADFLMDYMKSEAPFWKCEETANGRHWIEPRMQDRADKARWSKN